MEEVRRVKTAVMLPIYQLKNWVHRQKQQCSLRREADSPSVVPQIAVIICQAVSLSGHSLVKEATFGQRSTMLHLIILHNLPSNNNRLILNLENGGLLRNVDT